MTTRYPHTATITRPVPGAQNQTTGVPVAGTVTTLYQGPCSAQEPSRREGTELKGGAGIGGGVIAPGRVYSVFLPYADTIDSLKLGDLVTIEFKTNVQESTRITTIRRLEHMIEVEAA